MGAEHLRVVENEEEDAPDPLIGLTVDGRYAVESVLGEGGMGVVYRARHVVLNKLLALKVLRPEVSRDKEIMQRFRQEAQSASAIGSQHIIDISDFGTLDDGSTYFVMEYLEGCDLTSVVEDDEPVDPKRVLHIGKQLCDALGAAHEAGIVHRDMKPDNVYLIRRGQDDDFVKVLDFGIAKVGGANSKLTKAGQVFGTPHYMSPEQCAGHGVDQRTDIYAVGVILYELASGQVPFDADNLMGILTKHMYEQPIAPRSLPKPADISHELETVILRCLEKSADTRYQTMAEVKADLVALEQGLSPAPRPQSSHPSMSAEGVPTATAMALPTRKTGLYAGLGLAAVLLVGGAAALAFSLFAPPDEAEPAEAEAAAPSVADESAEGERAAADGETGGDTPSGELPPAIDEAPELVTISSEPAGVEVYQGDALLGNTPFEIARPSRGGRVAITLKRPGYHDRSFALTSSSSGSIHLSLRPERRRRGRAQPRRNRAPSPRPAARPRRSGNSEVLDPWAQ